MNQTAAYGYRGAFSRGDRRRIRRDRRRRQALGKQQVEQFHVKMTTEEQRRLTERKEYLDAIVSEVSKYSWSYFATLTFREPQGPESIDRAIKRFTRVVHENVFGEFNPVTDVRDLYGIRYLPAQERGWHGQKRLHAHLLMCGGEVLGERLANAKWLPWAQWWNKNCGGLKIEKPDSQAHVVEYCTKYMLKGVETGFELCSTWADERDRRKRAEAPLLEERKIGVDVVRSADCEKAAFRGEAPNGCGPTSKGSGKPCHRCKLVSLCRCWGTKESGQVVTTPESDAGACEGEAAEIAGIKAASPSPQLELRMQEQLALPLHASANKSGRFASRREKYLQRRRDYELRRSREVSVNTASNVPNGK